MVGCSRLVVMPLFWLKMVEMAVGITVCALFSTYYTFAGYSWNIADHLRYKYAVQSDLAIVSANGFLYINIILFIGLCVEKDFEKNILNPIFASIGVLVNVVAGGILLHNTIAAEDAFNLLYEHNIIEYRSSIFWDYNEILSTGSLFIIYAALYLADFVLYFRSTRKQQQAVQHKHEIESRF